MKVTTYALLTLSVIKIDTYAQEAHQGTSIIKKANIGLGVGVGRSIAISAFTTVGFTNNTYTGLHVLGTFFPPINKPLDYDPEYPPRDNFTSFSALFGKRFQKESALSSFAVEGGVSWIRYKKSFTYLNRPGLWNAHFTDYQIINKPGLLLGGRASRSFSQHVSLELSTYGSINTIRSTIIGNFSIVIDLLKNDYKNN